MVKEWFEIDQKRLLREIEEMRNKYPDFKIFYQKVNGRRKLAFKGNIEINGDKMYFGILYPFNYPFQKPKIGLVRDLKKSFHFLKDESGHQFSDHSKCIYPSDGGIHSWRYYYTSTDALKKLEAYFRTKKEGFDYFEHTSEEFDFPGIMGGDIAFIPKSIVDLIPKSRSITLKLLEVDLENEKIYWIIDENDEIFKKKQYRFLIKYNYMQKKILCIALTESPKDFKEKAYSFKDMNAFLESYFGIYFKKDLYANDGNLLLISQNNNIVIYLNLSNTPKKENKPTKIKFHRAKSISIPSTNFNRAERFLKDAFNYLGTTHVVLIGLGSIGSKIAVELVNSGVESFILYDYDRLEPENICRHIGRINELGMKKTTIVKNQLLSINPNCHIETHSENPVDGENVRKFRYRVQSSDLVVVSTGNYESEMFVNEITTRMRKPAVYCYALDEVNIGAIFYYNPSNGPCYECLQTNLDKDANPEYNLAFDQLTRPDMSQPKPGRSYYETPGIPGISIDIDFVSLLASKIIITILLKDDKPFSSFYSIFPHNKHLFLWKNRGNYLNFGLEAYSINKIDDCYFCSTKGRRLILDSKDRRYLSKLMFKYSKRKLDSEKI